MRVNFLTICVVLLIGSKTSAQIVIDGPKTARQKETIALTVKAPNVNDLVIKVFPKNKNWRLARNYDDPTIIEINFTPTTDGTYYFAISGNKEQKTLVEEHTLTVGDGVPTPDVDPTPKPKPSNPYAEDILAAYMVSPDADAKIKLIKIYNAIKNGSYTSWETTQLDLVAKIKEASLTDKLPGVKKAVSTLLTKDTKGVNYAASVKDKLFTQIVDALEAIK